MTSTESYRMSAGVVTATPAIPDSYGLYSAATIIEGQERAAAGVIVEPVNCGPSGQGAATCPPPGTDNPFGWDDTSLVRPANGLWSPVNVWTADYCSMVGRTPEQATSVAENLMRLREEQEVEAYFASKLLEIMGDPVGEGSVTRAIGTIEAVFHRFGIVGTIHVDRFNAAELARLNLIERKGSQLVTPLGNIWAFGNYSTLDGLAVGTGPVVVRRSAPFTVDGPDYRHNERVVLAQRTVLVSTECITAASALGF